MSPAGLDVESGLHRTHGGVLAAPGEGSKAGGRRPGSAGGRVGKVDLLLADPGSHVDHLGLDRVLVYAFDASKGTLAPLPEAAGAELKPGTGPRHIALDPRNKFAYVVNELDSTLTVFSWDAENGALKELQSVSTLPTGFEGRNYPAEVVVHPNGKFVFGSNRGHDSVVIFKIDEKTGTVTLVGHQSCGGHWPRRPDRLPKSN